MAAAPPGRSPMMRREAIPLIFMLVATDVASAQQIVRGPYLQRATPSSMTMMWRTDIPCGSRVAYAATIVGPANEVVDPASTTEHVVTLTGLHAGRHYLYAVGTPDKILAGGDAATAFRTAPVPATRLPIRVWVLGDSGTANGSARLVRDSYYAFSAQRATDLWLMLGDNAYDSGTDSEFQAAVFQDMYEAMLMTSPLWPTIGNHDAKSSDSPTQSGVYFEVFALPKAAEAGGTPSNTEAYYSFDYGNAHFLVLDSADSDRSVGGNMYQFAAADLLANHADWTFAYFHQPPYSKGSHDSDTEQDMIDMRVNFGPLLEQHGVDVVLTGHSHSYERTMLINGHYGPSTTFTSSMVVDGGDGAVQGSGAYQKAVLGPDANSGTVYVVAGASGKYSPGAFDHPAVIKAGSFLSSLVIDIHGSQLDVRGLRDNGDIFDHFTIVKAGAAALPITFEAFPKKAVWAYFDKGQDLGAGWRADDYDDSSWSSAPGVLGYGTGFIDSVLSYGGNSAQKYTTTYFRRSFSLPHDPDVVTGMRMLCNYDDGFVAYLNGKEVARRKLPDGPITSGTFAQFSDGGSYQWIDLDRFRGALRAGKNVIAVEVHQTTLSSADLVWDAALQYDAIEL